MTMVILNRELVHPRSELKSIIVEGQARVCAEHRGAWPSSWVLSGRRGMATKEETGDDQPKE